MLEVCPAKHMGMGVVKSDTKAINKESGEIIQKNNQFNVVAL